MSALSPMNGIPEYSMCPWMADVRIETTILRFELTSVATVDPILVPRTDRASTLFTRVEATTQRSKPVNQGAKISCFFVLFSRSGSWMLYTVSNTFVFYGSWRPPLV